jgi:hypothetical protein
MYPNVIIKSPDTDVFFIALNACSNISAQILFETGNQNKRRIISLEKVKFPVVFRVYWIPQFHRYIYDKVDTIKAIFYWLDPMALH